MNIRNSILLVCIALISITAPSCSNSVSYSDLLKDEQRASNWFLAQHRVCNEIPADSVFETGPDAPFYRLDPDGYIYMQVLDPGQGKIPAVGDQVYFTFTRWSVMSMYEQNTLDVDGQGNQNDFLNSVGQTYFIYGNMNVSSSSTYGSGIQKPVSYLGYNSEVNILLKSYYGFAAESTTCIPFLVNTRYFKAEY